MDISANWTQATIHYRASSSDMGRALGGGSQSGRVRIENGWVHLITAGDSQVGEADVVSVPADLIKEIRWSISMAEVARN